MITSNDIGSLTIPVILMISSYIYFIIDYNKYKNYNRIFTHSIVPILVITYTMYSGLAHILLQDRVSSSIGWASGGFQVEVGMFQVTIAILSIYYLIKKNIKALIALTLVWVVFMIQVTLFHLKEIIFDKNYAFNSVRPVITGILNIVFIYFIISKVDSNVWE